MAQDRLAAPKSPIWLSVAQVSARAAHRNSFGDGAVRFRDAMLMAAFGPDLVRACHQAMTTEVPSFA